MRAFGPATTNGLATNATIPAETTTRREDRPVRTFGAGIERAQGCTSKATTATTRGSNGT